MSSPLFVKAGDRIRIDTTTGSSKIDKAANHPVDLDNCVIVVQSCHSLVGFRRRLSKSRPCVSIFVPPKLDGVVKPPIILLSAVCVPATAIGSIGT